VNFNCNAIYVLFIECDMLKKGAGKHPPPQPTNN
jgi:hypothetical protein